MGRGTIAQSLERPKGPSLVQLYSRGFESLKTFFILLSLITPWHKVAGKIWSPNPSHAICGQTQKLERGAGKIIIVKETPECETVKKMSLNFLRKCLSTGPGRQPSNHQHRWFLSSGYQDDIQSLNPIQSSLSKNQRILNQEQKKFWSYSRTRSISILNFNFSPDLSLRRFSKFC